MRIRKNKKLSSLLFPHASAEKRPQPHVCKLNQAPWDVISDSEEPTNPSSSHLQFDGDDSLTGNGPSLGDSIGAVESVASMEKPEFIVVDDDKDDTEAERKKSLECNEEAKKMETEFGLKAENKTSSLLKSCNNSAPPRSSSPVTIKRGDKPVTRRGRGRGSGGAAATGKRGSSSSSRAKNPYEFYYYSGFGPLWGKRRGERSVRGGSGGEGRSKRQLAMENTAIVSDDAIAVGAATATNSGNTTTNNSSENNNTHSSSSSQFELRNNYADDYDDDDEEDYDHENSRETGKRKRMRKPVKARSLKSLM